MEKHKLVILWTNADPLMAEMMVLMYAENALRYGWWEEVQVVIWGPTAKLVAEDEGIQQLIASARSEGVQFSACKSCATKLEVADQLESVGMELRYWGVPLTEHLKDEGIEVLSI